MARTASSGQKTVTTAGTEVRLPDIPGNQFLIKALAANTGIVYIGNNGDETVSSSTGFELSAGDQVPVEVKNLSCLWLDSAVNGEGVSWIAITV